MDETLSIKLTKPLSAVRIGRSVSKRAGTAAPGAGETADPPETAGDRSVRIEALRRELEQACQAMGSAMEGVAALKDKLLKEAEGQLLELAVEIARKVLMQEIQAQRYQIEPIVKEALAHVPAHQEVSVHLNPQDLAQCQAALEAQHAGVGANVRYVADPAVPRAECVLRTGHGLVVSSIEDHLQCIAEALTKPE